MSLTIIPESFFLSRILAPFPLSNNFWDCFSMASKDLRQTVSSSRKDEKVVIGTLSVAQVFLPPRDNRGRQVPSHCPSAW